MSALDLALADAYARNDALAQQLAASQTDMREWSEIAVENGVKCNEIADQLAEAQATITRLEATTNKALDLDYQRRQEIAEAVGLLRGVCEYANGLHGEVFEAWAYAGSTASRKGHVDEDYLKSLAYLAAHDSDSK